MAHTDGTNVYICSKSRATLRSTVLLKLSYNGIARLTGLFQRPTAKTRYRVKKAYTTRVKVTTI
jgi:hypothetical protein